MNRTTAFHLLVQKDEAGVVLQVQLALDRPTFEGQEAERLWRYSVTRRR